MFAATTRYRAVRVTAPNFPTVPDPPALFGMSPVAAQGTATRHLRFYLLAPPVGAAVPAAGDFTVMVGLKDPVTGFYSLAQTFTGVRYGDSLLVRDVDAEDIFILIDNVQAAGLVDVFHSEM